MPPAGRASGSPSHTPRGWGFLGEVELGACASAPLQVRSAQWSQKRQCVHLICKIGESVCVHTRVYVCVHTYASVQMFRHAFVDGCAIRLCYVATDAYVSVCVLLLCLNMCK